MRKPSPRHRSSAALRAQQENRSGVIKIAIFGIAIALLGAAYISASRGNQQLDENLCPTTPTSITVLLVDVTDPLGVAQRQDFRNQLVSLRNSIPRYGKLIVVKVDSTSTDLLKPVIVRCNPGTAEDANDITGDPQGLQRRHREEFIEPLDRTFTDLTRASASDRSPIFESVQSVALTELLTPDVVDHPRKLVIVSDLLQNTDAVSFYGGVPEQSTFLASHQFRRVRSDLRSIEVELWMLERSDAPQTQPRALVNLWDAAIAEQGGTVERIYNVSG